jgi:dephospho-CoA kinase
VPKNIALSGRSGSGKTEIADYLVEKHGYTRCSSGAACREICKRFFGTDSKAILNRITDAFKAVDPDVWLNAALSSAAADAPVVFDSMRFITDYTFLKGRGFFTWRIEAPHNVRLDRMRERNQVVTPEDDEHRAETELDQEAFDQIIDNSEAGLELLYSKIERVLNG